jgi:hypothetical protein
MMTVHDGKEVLDTALGAGRWEMGNGKWEMGGYLMLAVNTESLS